MPDRMILVIGFKNGKDAHICYNPREASISISTNPDGSVKKIILNGTWTKLYYTDLKEINYIYTMEDYDD